MARKTVIVNMIVLFFMVAAKADIISGDFNQQFDVTWGNGRGKIINNGRLVKLQLDKASGSGFKSKNQYLFGKIDMQIKVVPGNSAGTVTSFYISSLGPAHDEVDFEFLGNLSGDPYILHTNVFVQGQGNREQQFYLWFDPARNFHTYSILWNPKTIILYVDGTPIRQYKNMPSYNIPFPNGQPMWILSSIWDAEWATRGGLVKTDWRLAPFTSLYRNFKMQVCTQFSPPSCHQEPWMTDLLDKFSARKLKRVQKKYMIYNYCSDVRRFPLGLPAECKHS
ncbi:xyloglucan endotransglucosylase/hydrolase 2-like [Cynara cardunculus var. scolymus]|uniref:xyloglucan endotransglucosylase/hydrolase 2-like n=1 Tax=Cynara cardunculus var. scolymus TaxID=59895 RepID=UPI000D627843|nr:xyloglucan endotransglucosylase/hydrolase 2-like [Cynara cardunculus var. scolymus]